MKPIRVAYLCEFPTLLGGERSLLQFLRSCPAYDIDPIVVAPPEGLLADTLAKRNLPHVAWKPGTKQDRLIRELASKHIELIHGNSLMVGDAALAVGAALGAPALTHVRDIMNLSPARLGRLASLAGLIAVSSAVREWLVGLGLPKDRISVIGNAVDPDRLSDEAIGPTIASELGLSDETRLIGCVGQICLRKGQDVFLSAAAEVARHAEDVAFVVIGARYSAKAESVQFEEALHEIARMPPLRGRVHFLGYRGDVPRILGRLDLLVVPSRQEPLSRVLLEGLALHVPAIATGVGGSPEILDGGRFGRLVPPDQPEELAAAMLEVLRERSAARDRASAASAWVRQRYSPETQARKIRQLYDRLLHANC
jgi:glycosyltransferase involved in cell wall biosynthesis